MFDKLIGVEERFIDIEKHLADPEVVQDRDAYQKFVREHAELNKIVTVYRKYKQTLNDLEESQELLKDADPDIKGLARDEITTLSLEKEKIEGELKALLLPKDPNDEKNVIVEIRAGTGGEEAALFAGDLFKMYSRYAEKRNWKVEVITHHPTGVGGLKEIIAMIQGQGAYSVFKYESGIHRVQRVPTTETQGRIHTSAVTVAVLAEAEEVDIEIDPSELKVDVYRATGPGGQSVNTTDAAVRITHLPTGLVVTCQDEKSQLKNLDKAMKELRSRLYNLEYQKRMDEISSKRKTMVSSGDRSAKIRTYNYSQGRVTDHRINLTLYNLQSIINGDIQEIIGKLQVAENAERLKESGMQ